MTSMFEIPIKVYCKECSEWIKESDIEFINGIEEDFQGRDILAFVCPVCDTDQKSFRK